MQRQMIKSIRTAPRKLEKAELRFVSGGANEEGSGVNEEGSGLNQGQLR